MLWEYDNLNLRPVEKGFKSSSSIPSIKLYKYFPSRLSKRSKSQESIFSFHINLSLHYLQELWQEERTLTVEGIKFIEIPCNVIVSRFRTERCRALHSIELLSAEEIKEGLEKCTSLQFPINMNRSMQWHYI